MSDRVDGARSLTDTDSNSLVSVLIKFCRAGARAPSSTLSPRFVNGFGLLVLSLLVPTAKCRNASFQWQTATNPDFSQNEKQNKKMKRREPEGREREKKNRPKQLPLYSILNRLTPPKHSKRRRHSKQQIKWMPCLLNDPHTFHTLYSKYSIVFGFYGRRSQFSHVGWIYRHHSVECRPFHPRRSAYLWVCEFMNKCA